MLAAYAQAGETFPERIVRMAESSTDVANRAAIVESSATSFAVKWGMAGTVAVSVLSIVAAVVLALLDVDNWWAVLTLPVLSSVPRIIDASRSRGEDH